MNKKGRHTHFLKHYRHTPTKEIKGNLRAQVDRGELKHLILRVLTSSLCFLGVRSTVLITFNIKSEGRNKKRFRLSRCSTPPRQPGAH